MILGSFPGNLGMYRVRIGFSCDNGLCKVCNFEVTMFCLKI